MLHTPTSLLWCISGSAPLGSYRKIKAPARRHSLLPFRFFERVIGGVRSKLNPPSIDLSILLIDRVLFDLNPRLPQVG